MSDLLERQFKFSRLLPKLFDKAFELGYEITVGEVYRTPEQAKINASKGSGISNSLHTQRLAIDIQLFLAGNYLNKSDSYRLLGEYWESLGGSWGGRFTRQDGNHFSLEFNGVK